MKATHILVRKASRELWLCRPGLRDLVVPILLGRNAHADKRVEGDQATPEGEFYVCAKNPRSRYFLSLCLSYPNAEDAARGLADGLISPVEHASILAAIAAGRLPPQHTRLGGEIYIHGHAPGAGDRWLDRDWTQGCIALDNAVMQEVYDAAELGTVVTVSR